MTRISPEVSTRIDSVAKYITSFGKLNPLDSRDCLIAIAVGLFFWGLNLCWFVFDHHVLSMDEAGHVICGLAYKDLLTQGSIFKGRWWHEFLTVNQFYPPTVYLETGILKSLFGPERLIDQLVASGSSLLLTASLFLSVRLLGFGVFASVLSAVFVNFYPEVSFLTHLIMLDMPAMAASSVGLFALLYWWQRQSLKVALFSGVVIGICCLTKQIVTAFLLGTGIFLVVCALLGASDKPRIVLVKQLAVLVAATVITGLPWIIANGSQMNSVNEYMYRDLESTGTRLSHFQCCIYYLRSYWPNMSPLLFTLFVVSFIFAGRKALCAIAPLAAGILLGFLFMCLYIYPFDRYVVTTFILPAVITGIFLSKLWDSGKLILRMVTVSAITAAALQFISFNFCPYPLSSFSLLSRYSEMLNVNIVTGFYDRPGNKYNPEPEREWGYRWTFEAIRNVDPGIIVYLNVLMNEPNLNAQTFSMYAKERGLPVIATTSLLWTVVGDEVEFTPEKAMYYQWYLVKKDGMKRKFKNETSRENYLRLLSYLDSSGKFELIDSFRTPEDSTLMLYRVK